jgi:hypothetical protein
MFHESFPSCSFFLQRTSSKGFLFSSVQAEGTKVEDSSCVELKKVKLEVILKVEAHRIFVLCSRKVMQQSLGKDSRSLIDF